MLTTVWNSCCWSSGINRSFTESGTRGKKIRSITVGKVKAKILCVKEEREFLSENKGENRSLVQVGYRLALNGGGHATLNNPIP